MIKLAMITMIAMIMLTLMITTIMIITALINDKKKRKRCIPEKMKERGKIQYYRREITAGGGNEIKA